MNRQSAGKTLEILNKYKELNSIIEVAKTLNVSYETVRKILRENGFASNKKKPVYSNTLNMDYFENIDTEDKAYFLGFIKADGYIDHTRNRFALRIQERDVEILQRLCDVLNLPQSRINIITKSKESTYYSENRQDNVEIAITNTRFVNHIKNVKSESILQRIPEHLVYHFIRGYFDGDGSINYRNIKSLKFSMNIMGNVNDDHMLRFIQKYFDINMYTDKRSNLPFLQTVNSNTIESFRNLCYNNCYIYLSRKKIKFDLFKFTKETSTTTRETSVMEEDIV
jgi:intein-encoded DNA endonuclease-like protein